jgi:branched-chain amino acid transport system ATP-binding protein
MPRLDVADVTVRFGGHTALSEVSVTAEEGTLTALIGPNGAGKTTLFNVITGLQRPDTGRVVLDGHDITRLSPHKRARHGLARTFQRLELFTMLSVRENIGVAADVHRSWAPRQHGTLDERVQRIIDLTGLGDVADTRVTTLPTGQCRVVELARALACDPKVLLLDEPASGQDEAETETFASLLRRLAEDGVAVLLVEHDVELVMEVCTTVHVLDFGALLAVGTPAQVQANTAVRAAYLGHLEEVGP